MGECKFIIPYLFFENYEIIIIIITFNRLHVAEYFIIVIFIYLHNFMKNITFILLVVVNQIILKKKLIQVRQML